MCTCVHIYIYVYAYIYIYAHVIHNTTSTYVASRPARLWLTVRRNLPAPFGRHSIVYYSVVYYSLVYYSISYYVMIVARSGDRRSCWVAPLV